MILKGYFEIINYNFPEVGHSSLDSDWDFGRIEKRLRLHENIYLLEQYRDKITVACKINHLTDMTTSFKLNNGKKNILGEKSCV